jgi:hypothetical protein
LWQILYTISTILNSTLTITSSEIRVTLDKLGITYSKIYILLIFVELGSLVFISRARSWRRRPAIRALSLLKMRLKGKFLLNVIQDILKCRIEILLCPDLLIWLRLRKLLVKLLSNFFLLLFYIIISLYSIVISFFIFISHSSSAELLSLTILATWISRLILNIWQMRVVRHFLLLYDINYFLMSHLRLFAHL